jgi:hypothetical protein
MANPDFFMGVGDSLPLLATTLIGPDDEPIDLTGCTITFEVAPVHGGDFTTRDVDADPDQVTNTGKVSCKVFDAGTSIPGLYEGRFVVIDGSGEQISVKNDRLITIEVTRRPGA